MKMLNVISNVCTEYNTKCLLNKYTTTKETMKLHVHSIFSFLSPVREVVNNVQRLALESKCGTLH